MWYSNEDIEKLNDSLQIEKIVGEFVELKKSGANYKGLCPFHSDTSPSFIISPSKNICKCFVCGAGGNPVSFYSNYKKINYDEAAKELIEKYNIPIKAREYSKKENLETNLYYEIMESAKIFFSEQIFENVGREALEYLTKRGVTPEEIAKNGLGFAPNSRNALSEFLLEKGYPLDKIEDLGLAKQSENGNYDAFRNRVMFPIYSLDKKVIAFGGRTLEEGKDIAKYINSSDTPIFKKGNILYGLGEKLQNIKKKNYAMLMEGYMDVLMATLNGFDATLAPLGTALTEEQGILLKRYTDNVILAFDMDAPGQKATEKSILILKEMGFSIRVLQYDGAKDPDEYIKKYGKESFLKVIRESLESFDFLYNLYSKEYDLNDIFAKQNFIKRFKDFFKSVQDRVEQSLYIDKLSSNIGMEKDILWESLVEKNKKIEKRKYKEDKELYVERKENDTVGTKCEVEYLTVSLILSDNSYYNYFKNKNIESELVKKIFGYFEKMYEQKKNIDFIELSRSEEFSEVEKQQILNFSLLNYGQYIGDVKRKELLSELLSEWLRKEMRVYKEENKNLLVMFEMKKIEMKLAEKLSISELNELEIRFNEIKKKFTDK